DRLARPGGKVTGVPADVQGDTLVGKRLELLKAAVPSLSRVAVLEDANVGRPGSTLAAREAAAQALRLELLLMNTRSPEDLASDFERVTQAHADGLLYIQAPVFRLDLAQIPALALTHRLPSISGGREFAAADGLMSYGPSLNAAFHRAAYYVARILKGPKPADLPVEQPREFEFIINLKTAQALGLTIPEHVLLQATEVIQ